MRAAVVASSSSTARAAASTSSPSSSPSSSSSLAARRRCSTSSVRTLSRTALSFPRRAARSASTALVVRAERDGSSGFTAGFILGGVVFGALGFLFAPQISSALLSDDQSRLKLPRFLDDEGGGDGRGSGSRGQPMTKQDLADRIAQLNSAIDDVSAQLRAQDEAAAAAAAGEEGEVVSEVAA